MRKHKKPPWEVVNTVEEIIVTVYKIYCDESRQTGSKYKLMSGIWIKQNMGWSFVNDFHNLCIENHGITPGHMKWTKVPPPPGKYYSCYTTLIDLYFKYNQQGHMFFKTIIADENYDFAHADFNGGDAEVGFYKLYYHMILTTLDSNYRYHLRVGSKNVSKKLHEMDERERLNILQNCLNNGFCKGTDYSYLHDVVLTTEPRLARDRRLIQLADIFMGAVGYQWNELHLEDNPKPGKLALMRYISDKLGRKTLRFVTTNKDRRFNIFRLKPKK